MKIIFIVIDGLGDKPIPALKNKTPLEAAKTPNLDFLARNGICGQIQPFKFPWQKYPESDTCHLALFGYDPKIYYLGRGPYEAAGIGFKFKKGDIALRVNFGTVDQNLKIIDRRAGRINETQPLVKALNGIKIEGIRFLVRKSFGHRAVLILRGKNLSAKIGDGDPKGINKKIRKIIPLEKSKKSRLTAKILNQFLTRSYQILTNHHLNKKRIKSGKLPANYLLVRGAGRFRKTTSFYQRYKLKACCIAGGALYRGIGKILGMDLIKIKGANGLISTNLRGKLLAAKRVLKNYNFVFCHIKAADNLGEDGNFRGKKEFIEKIDRDLKTLLGLKNTTIVVTGDHSTCSLLKRHCSEPIPILISGNGKDKVQKFGERVCKRGKLGKTKQLNLLPKILTIVEKKKIW